MVGSSSGAGQRRRVRRHHPRADHPAQRLGQPLGAHRFAHVVGGAQVEGVHRAVVVRGDEDDRRWPGEPAQHPGQLHAVQAGHPDVQEDHVDVGVAQHPQRLGGVAGRVQPGHPRVGAQVVRQLVERGRLVVHREDRRKRTRSRASRSHAHDPPVRRGGTSAPACSPSCPSPARSPRPGRTGPRRPSAAARRRWRGRRAGPGRRPGRRCRGPARRCRRSAWSDPCPPRRPPP